MPISKVNVTRLSKDEEQDLLQTIHNEEETSNTRRRARDKLIVHNMRFVDYTVKKYYGRLPADVKEDVRQEGAIGLDTAIDKFDMTRGVRFSTYAIWWIRQVINKSLSDNSKTIRTPVYVNEALNKINVACNEIFNLHGREATDAELEELVGYSAKRIAEFRNSALNLSTLEFDMGDNSQLSDVIEDEFAADPEKTHMMKDLNNKLSDILYKVLTPREEHIVRLRQGFGTAEIHTLEEIGDRLNLTKERVRQIESMAMKKLKKSSALIGFKKELE